MRKLGAKHVITGKFLRQFRILNLIVAYHFGYHLPELPGRIIAMFFQNTGDKAEYPGKDVSENRQNFKIFRYVHRQTFGFFRQAGVGVHHRNFLGDILHESIHRNIVFEPQDQVFAMRHKHQVVLIKAVQQRAEIGVHVAFKPVAGGQTG
ncbi:hypothetical protein SRABI106_04298 [Rahnella aquatilis]|nr:hypothetical protein SRABI106_04298 [Rahnella aquatilis]